MADEYDAVYVETSAKENLGVNELFIMIAKQMLMNYEEKVLEDEKHNNILLG